MGYLALLPDWAVFVMAKDVLFGLAGAGLLASAPVAAWRTQRAVRARRRGSTWRLGDVLYPCWALVGGAVLLAMAYDDVKERYLLREGAYRYAVAQVYKHSSQRGNRTFLYTYRVGRREYQSYTRCGISRGRALPCPPIGTRFYVQFSPEDPSVEQVTQLEVPDTVRRIPPLGWARLP